MSIQRYSLEFRYDDNGEWVDWNDHVAEVKRVWGEVISTNGDYITMPTLALDQIKQHTAKAMRAACIAAVEQVDGGEAVLVFREHVLAALREVQP